MKANQTFGEAFPEMVGLMWGNSQVELWLENIGHVRNGVAYTAPRQVSNSLSWSAYRQQDGAVVVEVQDNSCSEEDAFCETGEIVLPKKGFRCVQENFRELIVD